jgi:hypothetical protein
MKGGANIEDLKRDYYALRALVPKYLFLANELKNELSVNRFMREFIPTLTQELIDNIINTPETEFGELSPKFTDIINNKSNEPICHICKRNLITEDEILCIALIEKHFRHGSFEYFFEELGKFDEFKANPLLKNKCRIIQYHLLHFLNMLIVFIINIKCPKLSNLYLDLEKDSEVLNIIIKNTHKKSYYLLLLMYRYRYYNPIGSRKIKPIDFTKCITKLTDEFIMQKRFYTRFYYYFRNNYYNISLIRNILTFLLDYSSINEFGYLPYYDETTKKFICEPDTFFDVKFNLQRLFDNLELMCNNAELYDSEIKPDNIDTSGEGLNVDDFKKQLAELKEYIINKFLKRETPRFAWESAVARAQIKKFRTRVLERRDFSSGGASAGPSEIGRASCRERVLHTV